MLRQARKDYNKYLKRNTCNENKHRRPRIEILAEAIHSVKNMNTNVHKT